MDLSAIKQAIQKIWGVTMISYAHITHNRKQTVLEHLTGTAKLASSYSVDMLKGQAYLIGFAHDIGKYAEDFQKRLEGSTKKFEHSSCGAIELGELAKDELSQKLTYMLQYCIAGHHTGLPDGGTLADRADIGCTLHAKLARKKFYTGSADYSSYNDEIKLELPDNSELLKELEGSADPNDFIEKYAFFTRYLFSCLTDADFIDTERFYSPETDRELNADTSAMYRIINEKLSSFSADTPIKKARRELQEQAAANFGEKVNISILDMPTGSGKTLCSMKIALKKLTEHNKKRIIYVIPYTSIIEQTAEIFEELFGGYADIVQHHSNYCYDESDGTTAEKLKRSTENWDAPVIITTSVQFFQSLYHYKGSSLRKLHNTADSVIVFDEVHMLPTEYLQPCLRAIGYITEYLNSEVLMLSATMPDHSELIRKYAGNAACAELITDKSCFRYFQKCRYSYIGQTDMESIAEKAQQYGSSLIIVNSRKAARETYRLLPGRKYHLSTYMTPADRSKTIRRIRDDLARGERIIVVSTSLVEAGVDLDFQAVFRQLAGLDNILQSGGRCNREGRMEHGDVFIFETDEKLRGDIKVRASIVKEMLEKGQDITSGECVKEYYRRLFGFNYELIDKNSIANSTKGLDSIPFRSYAEGFELISEDTVSVVIDNCSETAELLAQLHFGGRSVKRKLQRYSVALRVHGEFDKALKSGLLRDTGDGVFVLANNDNYTAETGLDQDLQADYIF